MSLSILSSAQVMFASKCSGKVIKDRLGSYYGVQLAKVSGSFGRELTNTSVSWKKKKITVDAIKILLKPPKSLLFLLKFADDDIHCNN